MVGVCSRVIQGVYDKFDFTNLNSQLRDVRHWRCARVAIYATPDSLINTECSRKRQSGAYAYPECRRDGWKLNGNRDCNNKIACVNRTALNRVNTGGLHGFSKGVIGQTKRF